MLEFDITQLGITGLLIVLMWKTQNSKLKELCGRINHIEKVLMIKKVVNK